MEYGYYSKKLNKPFDTLEDLKKAEEKVIEKEKAAEKEKAERAGAAKEIEELIKKRDVLQREIDSKINEFIKKYGTYHFTYKTTFDNGLIDTLFRIF